MKKLVPLMLLPLLAACATESNVALSKGASGECRPEVVSWAVGQRASDALDLRLMKETGASHVRVLRPNQPATMDFRSDRLTLDINDQGSILSIRCG